MIKFPKVEGNRENFKNTRVIYGIFKISKSINIISNSRATIEFQKQKGINKNFKNMRADTKILKKARTTTKFCELTTHIKITKNTYTYTQHHCKT